MHDPTAQPEPHVSPPAQTHSDPMPTVKPKPRRVLRRLLLVTAVTVAVTYVAICAFIFAIQDRLIYFPPKSYAITPADFGSPFEEVALAAEDGVVLAAWYLPHATPRATILFCHGNAENLAGVVPTLKTFHQRGYAVFAFDYRGYGRSGGAPSEIGTYRDAEAAWRYLAETRGLAPETIVVFGRSLGGAVAIDLAGRHRPGALVAECTFTSLVDVGQREYPFLPVGLLCRHRYDSLKKVPHITCPKLFLHGTADELIPIENARRLFAAAAEPKEFIETPGGHESGGFEHNWEYTQRLAAWLARVVPGSTSQPTQPAD